MSDELLFVVDENNRPQKPLPRSYVIKNQLFRRVSSITVINKTNQTVLCQRRSDTKDERPGLWIVNFGGKSAADEDSLVTAQRELQEELGILTSPNDLVFYKTIRSDSRHQFEYLYYLFWEGDISTLTPDPDEVAEVKWFKINEAIELLLHDISWYSYDEDISLLRKMLAGHNTA